MGVRLGRGREWVSRLENQQAEFSDDVCFRIQALEAEAARHGAVMLPHTPHLNSGDSRDPAVEESAANYGQVASRIPQQRTPSTRADCEAYVQRLLDLAEQSDNPNAFPVIHDRLRKKFPLDEWEPPPRPETELE